MPDAVPGHAGTHPRSATEPTVTDAMKTTAYKPLKDAIWAAKAKAIQILLAVDVSAFWIQANRKTLPEKPSFEKIKDLI